MLRLVTALVVAVALAATPAAALAQDNPFLQDPSAPQQQQPVTPPAPAPIEDDDPDGGDAVSGIGALVIGAVVVLLIAGIWIYISRDARRHAPRRDGKHNARVNPDSGDRSAPGAAGLHKPRSPRHRKPSRAERERRKRGRAR